jgi:hypothetical protein
MCTKTETTFYKDIADFDRMNETGLSIMGGYRPGQTFIATRALFRHRDNQTATAIKSLHDATAVWPIRSTGKHTVTVVPMPISLCNSSEPPWTSASDLLRGKPSPVPS